MSMVQFNSRLISNTDYLSLWLGLCNFVFINLVTYKCKKEEKINEGRKDPDFISGFDEMQSNPQPCTHTNSHPAAHTCGGVLLILALCHSDVPQILRPSSPLTPDTSPLLAHPRG